LQKQITIENALATFERNERDAARARLEELWDEPEEEEAFADDAEGDGEEAEGGGMPELAPGPREGQREAVQARALLEKGGRLMEKVAPEARPEIERRMEKIRTALTDRKWDQVTAASNELADVLFYLEDA